MKITVLILSCIFLLNCSDNSSLHCRTPILESLKSKIRINGYDNLQNAKNCSNLSSKPILVLFYNDTPTVSDRNAIWNNFKANKIKSIILEKYVFLALQTDGVAINKSINYNLQIKLLKSNASPVLAIWDTEDDKVLKKCDYETIKDMLLLKRFLES